VVNSLPKPRTRRGIAPFKSFDKLQFHSSLLEMALRASGDTIPYDTRNSPTPTSIRPTPYVSVFANLLGNAGKSTAKMATIVSNMMDTLACVTNGKGLGTDIWRIFQQL
jgi:hypothetical protein